MSNQLSKLKCVKSKKIQKNDIRRAMNNQKVATINFMDRVIPNSLVIDVKKSDIRIGNETDKIKDIEPAFNAGLMNDDDSAKLLEFLAQFNEETIQKVILDNTENFKIMKLSEFIELINKKVIDKDNPAADSKEALTYYGVNKVINQIITDEAGNIFCIVVKDIDDYYLLRLDAQFNLIEEIHAYDINLSDDDNFNEIVTLCKVDDGVALLMTSDDDKYIVRYDKDFNCVSKRVLCCDYDIQFNTLVYHEKCYYCTGRVDDSNESFIRVYDIELLLLKHIAVTNEDKLFVLNTIEVTDDIVYIAGGICSPDGEEVSGLILTIDDSTEISSRFNISFNEKYSFITDIKFNQLTNQLIVAGISSDDDKHFKLITMIMNPDLSVIKAKSFVSEDLTVGIQNNTNADHQLVLLDNGEIMSSACCNTKIGDISTGGILLLHHSAELGLIETKMLINPDAIDTTGYIGKYQDSIIVTLLETATVDCEYSCSAVMKVNRDKLFNVFYPISANGNPVTELARYQSDCRSFSIEDSLVSISPV